MLVYIKKKCSKFTVYILFICTICLPVAIVLLGVVDYLSDTRYRYKNIAWVGEQESIASEPNKPSERAVIKCLYGSIILVIYNALLISYLVGIFAFLHDIIVSDNFTEQYAVRQLNTNLNIQHYFIRQLNTTLLYQII